MAKQNVTYIERHAEKFVIGVCGAALLVVAYLYLIQDPHRVAAGGEEVGPKEFYASFEGKASQSLENMKRRTLQQADQAPGTEAVAARDTQKPPLEIEVAFAPPGPVVPELTGGGPGDKVTLAEIIPPTKPVTCTGHSGATLPVRTIIVGSQDVPAAPAQQRDEVWISLVAAIERKKQREVFQRADYMAMRQTLIVAGIEAERQERLATGEWGSSQIIRGYSPVQVQGQREIELIEEEGTYRPTQEAEQYIALYRQTLEQGEVQEQTLRPQLQPQLANPYAWAPPAKLAELDIDLLEFGFVPWVEEEQPKPVRQPAAQPVRAAAPGPRMGGGGLDEGVGRGGPGRGGRDRGMAPRAPREPAGGPERNAAVVKALGLIKQAEEHIKKSEFIEAEALLKEVVAAEDLPKPMRDNAERLLSTHAPAITEAIEAARRKEELREASRNLGLGRDVDPIWFHDLTVVPGKTYRYRLRVVALNQYAGISIYLEEPRDAAKLIVDGQWSEWSEPQTAAPDKRLFLASVKPENQSVRLEFNQWSGGQWNPTELIDIGVGEPVASTGKKAFSYDAILADIDLQRSWSDRTVRKDGAIQLAAPSETQAVTLVRLDGTVEERIAAQDRVAKRAFQQERDTERKQLQADRPQFQAPGSYGPSPSPLMPGMRGMEGLDRGFDRGLEGPGRGRGLLE